MRISREQVEQLVSELCIQANFYLPEDVYQALQAAAERETAPAARWALGQIVRNAEVAASEGLPLCQDTGLVVCFATVGRKLDVDFDLRNAINRGVAKAYTTAPLRKSVLADPLRRDSNTGNNTPAVVYFDFEEGEALEIAVLIKGGGSENASRTWMLTPAEGEEGIVKAVVEHVQAQGGKWCPPGIIGLGVGGTLDYAAVLSKKALLRPVGQPNPDEHWATLEREILRAVNEQGPGAMGLGGRTTALAVHIEYAPCHIASLPVAMTLQCHAARHARGRLP